MKIVLRYNEKNILFISMNYFVGCINEMYYGLCFVLFIVCVIGGFFERYRFRYFRVFFDVLRFG